MHWEGHRRPQFQVQTAPHRDIGGVYVVVQPNRTAVKAKLRRQGRVDLIASNQSSGGPKKLSMVLMLIKKERLGKTRIATRWSQGMFRRTCCWRRRPAPIWPCTSCSVVGDWSDSGIRRDNIRNDAASHPYALVDAVSMSRAFRTSGGIHRSGRRVHPWEAFEAVLGTFYLAVDSVKYRCTSA